jgi:hypothetical protein
MANCLTWHFFRRVLYALPLQLVVTIGLGWWPNSWQWWAIAISVAFFVALEKNDDG